MMAKLVRIECEGNDLEAARAVAGQELPAAAVVVLERILADGAPRAVRATDQTTDAAFSRAASQVPKSARVLSRQVANEPGSRMITVHAFDEDSAKSKANEETEEGESLASLRLVERPSSGFLGLGRKPGRYEALLDREACVVVSYASQAKVRCWVGDPRVKPVVEAMKAWYRSQAGPRQGICDDCNADLVSQAFLRPGGYLCCEPCTDTVLGEYVDWDDAFKDIDRTLGPGVPASVKALISAPSQ
jgi:hypothetical protein